MSVPNFVHKLIDQVAKDNGFKNLSVEISSGSEAGDGFCSKLYRIAIAESQSDKLINLIIKVAPLGETHRKEFFSDLTFKRETSFFSKFMPIFAEFQEKRLVKEKQFSSYPKCYATFIDDNSFEYAVVLEDLRPQNFIMWNKAKLSPIENLHLVMRELGKFHALSFAMKDQQPHEFEEMTRADDLFLQFLQSKTIQGMYDKMYSETIKILKSEDHKNVLRHMKENLLAYFKDCLGEKAAEPFGVLCHGTVF